MIEKNPPAQQLNLDESNAKVLSALGQNLKRKFDGYASARRDVEGQWVKNLRQFLGKYDPELEAQFEADQSRAYPRVTRVKVMALVSRLMALLFPTDEKNWGLSAGSFPTIDTAGLREAFEQWTQENPQAPVTQDNIDEVLRAYADKQAQTTELFLDDQLKQMGDYVTLIRKVIISAVIYSVGVLRGPMTIAHTRSTPKLLDTGEWTVASETVYTPYFEFVPVWDYYPDFTAKSLKDMEGEFERHVLNRQQLKRLADRPDFITDAVNRYLADNQSGNWQASTFEEDLRTISTTKTAKDGSKLYNVLSYWGFVTGAELRAAGEDVADSELSEHIVANVWLIGDTVIKAKRSPFDGDYAYYNKFVFEDDDVNLLGSGLPPVMRDSQLSVCLAARMIIDNASVCCGPQFEADMTLLRSDQNLSAIRAFKVWYKEGGYGSSGNSQRAVIPIQVDSNISELVQVFDLFMRMIETETFVGQSTGGDFENVPGEAMRTTAGASMLMGATALPFRDIVRNFDAFTTSVIASLYSWNRVFNKDKVKGDLQPVARGATSLIAKEVRAAALDNLANTLRPEEAVHINWRQMAKSRVTVRDLHASDVLVSDTEAKAREDASAKAQQDAEELQRRATEATIRDTLAGAFKDIAQGKKNLDAAQLAQFSAVLSSLEKSIDPSHVAGFLSSSDQAVEAGQAPAGGAGTQVDFGGRPPEGFGPAGAGVPY